MATAQDTHHVVINGIGLMLAGGGLGYSRGSVSDFAPKVGSGQTGYGDLQFYSVLGQSDWHRGFGNAQFTDELGYEHSTGSIDAGFDGIIQLATRKRTADTPTAYPVKFVDFGSYTYSLNSTGVRYGFFSDFDDTTVPGGLTSLTSGSGSVATSSSTLVLTATSAADAGAVYATRALSSTKTFSFRAKAKATVPTGGATHFLIVMEKATAPAAGSSGTYDINVFQNDGGAFTIYYRDSGGTLHYYKGSTSSWTTTSSDTAYAGAENTYYEVALVNTGTGWYITLADAHGTVLVTTGTVTWANTSAIGNSWWLVLGDPTTDAVGGTLTVDWLEFWDDTSETTGTCTWGMNEGTNLVVCKAGDSAQLRYSADGVTFANAGNSSTPPYDVKKIIPHGGQLWTYGDAEHWVHHNQYLNEDIAGAGIAGGAGPEGASPMDSASFYVGPFGSYISNLCSYRNTLFVFKPEGAWATSKEDADPLQGQRPVATNVLNWSMIRDTENFQAVQVYKGWMYYNVRNRLWRWNGDMEQDVTPPQRGTAHPYKTYGRFSFMGTRGDYLYVVARTNDATFEEHLLRYDGAFWHNIGLLATSPAYVSAFDISPLTDRIMIGIRNGSSYSVDTIRLQPLSNLPFSDYSVGGTTDTIYTSQFDAGWPEMTKFFRKLDIECNTTSTSKTITVEYALDGGSWYSLGLIAANATNHTLYFPGNETAWAAGTVYTVNDHVPGYTCILGHSAASANEPGVGGDWATYWGQQGDNDGKKLQLRFSLTTADSTSSPVLEKFTLQYLARPSIIYQHRFDILTADNLPLLTGIRDHRTGAEIRADLEAIRALTAPCVFYDPDGTSHSGLATDLSFTMSQYPGRDRPQDVEMRGILTMIELT